MATSSFDTCFRIETKEDTQVFIEALEESVLNPQAEQPRAKRHTGDLTETIKKILVRYAK